MSKKKLHIEIEEDKYYSLGAVAKFLGYSHPNSVRYHIDKGTIDKKYLAITRTLSNQRQMIKGEGILKLLAGKE